jgi:hypothetical protein
VDLLQTARPEQGALDAGARTSGRFGVQIEERHWLISTSADLREPKRRERSAHHTHRTYCGAIQAGA